MSESRVARHGERLPPPEQYVLCIDDDTDFLQSLELFLPEEVNRAGTSEIWYRFLFFTDPLVALQALRELLAERAVVAMVICDQKMPHMKGTELFAEMKGLCGDSVRVLLTGHAGMESAITAINEHLLDKYLTKPIENEHDFILSVFHLLQRFQMERTIRAQGEALHSLYEFSNRLNAFETYDETLHGIASFAKETVRCRQLGLLLRRDGALEPAILLSDSSPADDGGIFDLPALREIIRRVEGKEEIDAVQFITLPSGSVTPDADRSADVSMGTIAADPASSDAVRSRTTEAGPAWSDVQTPKACVVAGLTHADEAMGLIVALDRADESPFSASDGEILCCIANTASIALRNQLNRLQLRTLCTEATERAAALADAKARLENLDRLKNDFLTFISHELRTPLCQMSAVGLLDFSASSPEQARIVEAARVGYERLEAMVLQGLEYFEWIAIDGADSSETVDLVDLVKVALQRPALESVICDVRVPDEPCAVRIEEQRLTQVLQILLDNAIKFTRGQKWVRITVARGAETVRLSVQDRGIGFPQELAADILRPFTIGHIQSHTRGSALNLAKAAAFVEAYGGAIEAASEGEGLGATFSVTLPLDRRGTDAAPDRHRVPLRDAA